MSGCALRTGFQPLDFCWSTHLGLAPQAGLERALGPERKDNATTESSTGFAEPVGNETRLLARPFRLLYLNFFLTDLGGARMTIESSLAASLGVERLASAAPDDDAG